MIKNVGPLDPNEGKEIVESKGENNEGEKKETVQTELEKDKILQAPK